MIAKIKAHSKKIIILLALLLVAGGAFFFLAMKHNASPEVPVEPVEKNETLKDISDEEIEFDPAGEERDLLHSVRLKEHMYKIPERSYPLKPTKVIHYVRAIFYLQVRTEKDLDTLEINDALVQETLGNVIRSQSSEDFEGVAGKEAVRKKIVDALNKQLPVPVIGVRYGSFTLL